MTHDDDTFTYKGGFRRLVSDPEGKSHAAYPGMEETVRAFAAPGFDHLASEIIVPQPDPVTPQHTAQEKQAELLHHFQGRPALLALHALTIAAARRHAPPENARQIFLDLWRTQSGFLLKNLDTRWKISALQTFETFGETEAQRTTACELGVFFAMIKLYETERLFTGFKPDQPFHFGKRVRARLSMDLAPYAIDRGDLDRNMLTRLWTRAESDPLMRPLACHLLLMVNRSPATVFRRLKLMRTALAKMRAARKTKAENQG